MCQKIPENEIQDLMEVVDMNSRQLTELVDNIIKPYCKDLDRYVNFIRECLGDGENPPTTAELDDFCLNLSTLIYYASEKCEQLGIKDDIAKSMFKEKYNLARENQKGTVADKNSYAELIAQTEQVSSICYTRAWKIMKAKVENAQELLSSCKKVLTRRITEMQLTNIGG